MILVDTNVVIRSYEAWQALLVPCSSRSGDHFQQIDQRWKDMFRKHDLFTINEVLNEITRHPAKRWVDLVRKEFSGRICKPCSKYYNALEEICNFVRCNWPTQHADEFLRGADAHLVAMAKAKGCSIVTIETSNIPSFNQSGGCFEGKVNLPYVAWRFGVRTRTIFDIFDP